MRAVTVFASLALFIAGAIAMERSGEAEAVAAVERMDSLNAELKSMMDAVAAHSDEMDADEEAAVEEEAEEQATAERAASNSDESAAILAEVEQLDASIDADVDAAFLQFEDAVDADEQADEEADEEAEEDMEGEEDMESEVDADADADAEEESPAPSVAGSKKATKARARAALSAILQSGRISREDVRNISPSAINKRHAGRVGGRRDATRLGAGKGKHIALKSTPVYDGTGKVIANAKEQDVGGHAFNGFNAGAYTTINGAKCVLGFRLRTDKGRVTGWVPVERVSPAPEVVAYTKAVRRAIRKLLPSDGGKKFTTYKITAVALKKPNKYYVFPHQKGRENRAKYYYPSKKTGVVNVLLNVPVRGTDKYGSAMTVLPVGASFNRVLGVPSISIPLYKKNAKHPAKDRALRFVWGFYASADGKSKQYGWINAKVLGV